MATATPTSRLAANPPLGSQQLSTIHVLASVEISCRVGGFFDPRFDRSQGSLSGMFSTTIAIALACLATADTDASKPNLLILVADDLGYGDLGCFRACQDQDAASRSHGAGGVRLDLVLLRCARSAHRRGRPSSRAHIPTGSACATGSKRDRASTCLEPRSASFNASGAPATRRAWRASGI